MLSILLIKANHSVRVEQIIGELWPERVPDSAENLVRQYVSQLRRRLRSDLRKAGHDGHLIETAPAGYILNLRPGDLDRDVFEARVSQAQKAAGAGQPATAQDQLDEALQLWRGPFLADVPASPTIVGEAARLEERRFGALELRLQVKLAEGRYAELLSDITGLVPAHPHRESLRELQLRALYGAGRRAEALAAYQSLRTEFADELGIDPGPRINAIHSAVLDDDVAALQLPASANGLGDPVAGAAIRMVPAQLPSTPPDLVLDETRPEFNADAAADGEPARPLTVVSGMTGTGKTTLAVHHGHRVRADFPDGQLFVPLHGSSRSPTDPAEALRRILWAFDGVADHIPDSIEVAADLYRSYLAERRTLVILDDAIDEEQVRPLLPGGPGNSVIVTSTRSLAGLEGARHVRIGTLATGQGLRLLRGIIGPERIDREPEAAREIAAQCAELPLAIRIAGGILVANPHLTLVQLAQRLTSGDVLSKLSVGGLDLRDRLAGNWQSLEPGLQGVLRKASAMPDDFSSAMIARELGDDQSTASLRLDETIEALDRLSATSLLDVVDRGAPGEPVHYRVNGLMRAWMAEGGRRVTSVPAEQFRTEPLDRKGTAARVTHRLLHHRIRPVDGRLVLLPRGCSG